MDKFLRLRRFPVRRAIFFQVQGQKHPQETGEWLW